MRPTIRLVLLTAARDRLFVSAYGALAAALALSAYIGGWSVFEPAETAVVYAAGGVRIVLALGLAIFVAVHIERLYSTREIEAILSRAISRAQFVVAYLLAIGLVALALVVPVAALVALAAQSPQGAVYWVLSLLFEALIVVAFTMFAALTFERAIPSVFAAAVFYALARLVGLFTSLTELGRQGGINRIANPIADAIALAVPRLDLFCQTRWLIYGPLPQESLAIFVAQTAIFVPLLALAGIYDLRRKQF
jgi:hypothetical protein